MSNITEILKETIQHHLVENSVSNAVGIVITQGILADLTIKCGGKAFYMPNAFAERVSEKHDQVLADLKSGMALSAACEKHQISATWVPRIIKRERQNETVS